MTTLTSHNCESLCKFMLDTCHVPYPITRAVVQPLLPLKVDAFDMFRLGLAMINYLPELSSKDLALDELQGDMPNMWVHGRVLDVDVREETPGRFSVYLEMLMMSTKLAGRLMKFRIPYTQLKHVFCALGLRARVKETESVIPRELCSMYAHIHLGDTDHVAFGILGWSATASEKKRNKELVQLRKHKDCSRTDVQCVDCPLGKDRCALACRKMTIDDEQRSS